MALILVGVTLLGVVQTVDHRQNAEQQHSAGRKSTDGGYQQLAEEEPCATPESFYSQLVKCCLFLQWLLYPEGFAAQVCPNRPGHSRRHNAFGGLQLGWWLTAVILDIFSSANTELLSSTVCFGISACNPVLALLLDIFVVGSFTTASTHVKLLLLGLNREK